MKTNSLSFGRWCWTLGFLGTFLLTASPEDQPVITSIHSQGTNVVVSVQVPAGIRRVTLESRHLWDVYPSGGITREVYWQMLGERSEGDVYQCLAWLYDGSSTPGQA